MTKSPRVIFFGNEQLCTGIVEEKTPLFDWLLAHNYNIAAVVLRPDAPKGRSHTPQASLIKSKAIERNIPVLQPATAADLYTELKMYSYCIGVLASFGRIVPQNVIDLFEPYGIVNIHPSLLPRYRGSSPIEATILSGDSRAGVSLMRLSSAMDEGPLFASHSIELTGTETKFDLYDRLTNAACELLQTTLPGIINGSVVATPQQSSDVSYTSRISKSDGVSSVTTDTALTIERRVRAYLNFPKTKLRINSIDVIVTMVKAVSSPDPTSLVLSCKDGTYLQIDELIAPSGKKMNADAFIRGYLK